MNYSIQYENKKDVEEILNGNISNFFEIFSFNITKTKKDDNLLFYGDNKQVLRSLIENYAGKIQMIYIDPPYAKKQAFHNRKQEHAYNDLSFGAEYIEFLRERLILLRELLAPNGSIFVHLDETMAFPIKVIMDEVFGENNFKNWITRQKSNPKNSVTKKFGNISDYILFYSKNKNMKFNQQYTEWDHDDAIKEYQYIEEGSGRRYKKVPIHAPGIRNGETGKEWKGMLPPLGKHWQYTPDTLTKMDEKGEIYWSSTGNPRRKIYLDQSKGKIVQDIWLDFKDPHNQNIKITGYPTEKNEDLIQRIIKASSDEGDIILDAFMGSGTVASAAEKLNRNWIGIDSSELAIKTIIERLLFGTSKMGDYVNSNQVELNLNHTNNNFSLYGLEDNDELTEWCHQALQKSIPQ